MATIIIGIINFFISRVVQIPKVINFKIAMIYYWNRFIFFCKIVKNKTIGFRAIHDSLFEQNALWIGVFGMRIPESPPASDGRGICGGFPNVSCHLYHAIISWNPWFAICVQTPQLPKIHYRHGHY